jgi:hypothetical protein
VLATALRDGAVARTGEPGERVVGEPSVLN